MIPTTKWEPSRTDILFQESLLRTLKDGSVWGVPCSESVFKFDKTRKTFCLIAGNPNDETNRRIAKIMKMFGYSEVLNTEAKRDDDV